MKNNKSLKKKLLDLNLTEELSEKIITEVKNFMFEKFLNDPEYEEGLSYCKNCGLELSEIK